MVAQSRAVVVILSGNSLQSLVQLVAIVEAMCMLDVGSYRMREISSYSLKTAATAAAHGSWEKDLATELYA